MLQVWLNTNVGECGGNDNNDDPTHFMLGTVVVLG